MYGALYYIRNEKVRLRTRLCVSVCKSKSESSECRVIMQKSIKETIRNEPTNEQVQCSSGAHLAAYIYIYVFCICKMDMCVQCIRVRVQTGIFM